jgi:hypothetical protein
LEVFEFQQLLADRFKGVRCKVTDQAPKYVELGCKGCGWTMLFRTSILEKWAMRSDDALSGWLLRHALCKKTYAT